MNVFHLRNRFRSLPDWNRKKTALARTKAACPLANAVGEVAQVAVAGGSAADPQQRSLMGSVSLLYDPKRQPLERDADTDRGELQADSDIQCAYDAWIRVQQHRIQ